MRSIHFPQHTRVETPPFDPELAFEVGADEFALASGFWCSELGELERLGFTRIEERLDRWRRGRDAWARSFERRRGWIACPMIEVGKVPGPELVVVGDDAELASRFEATPDVEQGLMLDDPFFVVLFLWPGVGEVEVDDIDRLVGAPPFEQLGRVGVEHADIGVGVFALLLSADAIGDIGSELASPFDAQEVGVRLKMRLLDQKRALARADFELEAFGRVFEPCAQIKPGGFGVVDDRIGEHGQLGLRDRNHAGRGVECFSMAESE